MTDGPDGPDGAAGGNEIAGVVYGPAVQAHVIHGSVHLHQRAFRVPPPAQLPPPGRLTGRDRDLAAIDAARDHRVIVLTGQPGVGKTTLAVHWGHRVRCDFPDGVLFADLHGYAPDGPARPTEELARFLRALGADPQQIPAELAELTAMYRSLMADRRMLVVLDDALTAAQVSPLLPPSPASVAVVTSRARLGALVARGARIVHLGRLEAEAAVELLASTLGDDRAQAEPRAACELVDLCDGVPLALCVAGARLAARTRWSISEMVTALRSERRRLATLAMEDDMAVRSALDVSYSALDPAVQRMYRLLSLFPGICFDGGLAAAAATVPAEEAGRLLGVLADVNLLDDAADGQYRYHDLTRLHAREMAERHQTPADRSVVIRRILDWFLTAVARAGQSVAQYRGSLELEIRFPPADPAFFPDSATALDWLDRELANVIAVARLAVANGMGRVAWQLADAMWPLFLYRGRYAERLELDELALAAAHDRGDVAGEAKMLNRLGLLAMGRGEHERAREYFGQALETWQRIGDDNRVAGGLRRMGLVAMASGQSAEAIGWFTRALERYTALGTVKSAVRKRALTLSDLGDALTAAGRPAAAIGPLATAADLLASADDPYNHARTYVRLGRAHERVGDPDSAAPHLARALHAMRDIGSSQGEADALLALGDLAARTGRAEQARERYTDAQRIFLGIGSPREREASDRLSRLGT